MKSLKTEVVTDPACGTGGFLVEAFRQMSAGIANSARLRSQWQTLRPQSKRELLISRRCPMLSLMRWCGVKRRMAW